jgi:3-oxoacyl-[acyl-carrier-protein] synthase III
MKIRAAITGVGGYVPPTVLSNHDLEKMVDTTDEWIMARTGIRERRILRGEGQGVSVMIIEAVKQLLERKNLDPLDIDLLIVGTVTPDHVFPATSNIVTAAMGMKNAWGFDLSAACSGFLYSLATGAQFIETGRYKKVIVVGADKMSAIVDYTDRTTCVIFGDGCGAVLLEPSEDENGIQDFMLHADGNGCQHLHMKAGGSAHPSTAETVEKKMHYIYQEGQAVYKHAVYNMAEVSANIMARNNLKADDVAYLLAHQANKRIIDATANRMGIGGDKVLMNIERYGNTTSGTIPLLMYDFEKQLKKGDNLILSAFGGGFTWGAIYLRWSYDTN